MVILVEMFVSFFISIIFIELLIKYWYPIYNQFCFILCYNEKDEGVSL